MRSASRRASRGDAGRRPRDRGRRCATASALLADDRYRVVDSEVDRRIVLSDPGIDDFRNELLWSPERPTLLDAEIAPVATASTVDRRVQLVHRAALGARSCATASCSTAGPTCCAWCSTRATGPTRCWPRRATTALRRDVELAKAMGFNGVRKHQKIEDPRYLYWADRLGPAGLGGDAVGLSLHPHRDQAHGARMERGDRSRLQPPVHHRLGAVQRVVGRARADRGAGAAPRGRGAVPPDQDARRDAAGDRQRRLGERARPTSSASTTTTPTPSTSASATAPRSRPSSCSTGAARAAAS